MKEMICIICPKGCRLKVDNNDDYKVSGNACGRGAVYGRSEAKAPVRILTATVRVESGNIVLLPVKSSQPIPKELLIEAVAVLRGITVSAPVKAGGVVYKNICGSGADIIAGCEAAGGVDGLV